jgi:glycosyltransferase involved in cell wall biosynthesis
MNPLISIITVCYNSFDTIENTINSVLNQTYHDIEYIIIDGGSTDGTLDIIKKYKKSIDILISEPDNGMYDALNKGVKLASGEWIGILNSGDLFHNSDAIMNVFSNPIGSEIGVVYGNSVELADCQRIERIPKSQTGNRKYPPDYRHGASFVRNRVHKKYLFDLDKKSKYEYGLDYLQIFAMYKNNVKFLYVNETILDYQKEGMSNHPWKNKYLRALIVNDGRKSLAFYKDFVIGCVQAAIRKLR